VEASRRARDRYSDLDYILWGFAAERLLGSGLESLLRRALLDPMGVSGGVRVSPGRRAGVLPCLCDTDREVELAAQQGLRIARRGPPARGEPQDGNARFLGSLAGHAGLFVTADAMTALAREWLRALEGRSPLLERAAARDALAGTGEYALGWARRRVGGSSGPALSRSSFGHVGFTGGSVWVDPDRGAIYLLLAHRTAASSPLNAARRRFHELAAAVAGAGLC
jgi:CubicO group peptidase (beta-lactamase class C family)